jgi:hypothetical protein
MEIPRSIEKEKWLIQASHFVVLIHGLQGNSGHMESLAESLKQRHGETLILNVSANDKGSL